MKKKDPKRQRKAILKHSDESPEGSSGDVRSLTHELGVHQEELRVQNEELQRAQLELSSARDRYKELFDSAPIGYLILDSSFMIREVNLTAADLLGTPRKDLIGTSLSKFMARTDADTFYLHLMAVMNKSTQQSCELAVRRPDGSLFHAYLETSLYLDSLFGNGWRIALIDITERKRAEESILHAKEEWERTFDTVPDLIAILDDQHRIVRVNKAMADRLGVTPKQCIGLPCYEAVHGLSEPPAFCPHSLTCRDGQQHVSEVHEPRLGGDSIVSTTPLCDRAGRLVGSVHVVRDINERKRAEESLRQAHVRSEWLARFPEENPNPIIRVSSEGEALYCNPAATELDGWKCKVDQVLAEPLLSLVRQAITEGREVKQDENLGERIYAIVVVPIPEGGYANVYGRDITERKRMEKELRKGKDELEERVKERTYELYAESLYARSLIDASLDPLVTISVDGKITDVNHASEEVTGVSREQLIGSDFSDYFTEPEKARAGYEEVFRQGFVRDYPLELKRRDGHITPVLYNASVYRDVTGQIMGVFAAARDITERKQAEAALRKLASELVMAEERERKRIAGVLHDEVAQTLAAAKMQIDMIKNIPSDSKDQHALKDAKELLRQSIQETRALMTDIGNPLLFDLGLQAACESLANRLMDRHSVRISCDMRDTFKHLNQDVKIILYQVFRELLNNVVKHSHAQNACVRIDMEDGHFQLKVTDDGVGFDTRMLGAPTLKGGFGLYSIRERLIAISGSLRIESTPGIGTVVTAILPAVLN
jgi:PAS domain S-box-containing protein